jgi:aryl-alcohol dehydrogenase-like predicted oxidoreductase
MTYGAPERGAHPWTLGEEQSRPFLARALELGVNFFDTSNSYSDGTSEEIVGRALRDLARRDEVARVGARQRGLAVGARSERDGAGVDAQVPGEDRPQAAACVGESNARLGLSQAIAVLQLVRGERRRHAVGAVG